jgi:uncharacterized membrane protein YozB (DUF420 family)
MDPKLMFWTAALLNMGVIVALVIVGVRAVRRGAVARHRRCMKSAAWLIVAFIGSYVLKLAFLGREALSTWSPASLWTLRFHETCVLAMIVGGSIALLRARSMRRNSNVTRQPGDPKAAAGTVRWHRRGGWAAVTGAGLGFASAFFVLLGMFGRSG